MPQPHARRIPAANEHMSLERVLLFGDAVMASVLGLATALRMFLVLRRQPQSPRWWLGEHFTSMIQSGAGAHVAFLFFGLPRVLPAFAGSGMQNLAWLTPIILAGIAQPLLARKYMRRPTLPSGTIAMQQ